MLECAMPEPGNMGDQFRHPDGEDVPTECGNFSYRLEGSNALSHEMSLNVVEVSAPRGLAHLLRPPVACKPRFWRSSGSNLQISGQRVLR